MKAVYKFTILISSFLFLSSCEDVVQIKLDEGSKLYVIDAFVNNLRSPQTIRVVTNDTYFSNREAPPVTGAVVVLNDLTSNTQYNFSYVSNGNYVYNVLPGDTIARVNHQYQLNVTIDGNTYYSLTTQKRTAVVDSISTFLNEGQGFGPPPEDSTYLCLLYARDKADDIADYYWIKTFRNDTLFSGSNDININIDGTGGAVVGAGADTIAFTPPSTFLSFKQYRKNDSVKVEIHSISRENYFFFVQAQNQINNGGLFATTPENVKTNITTPKGAKTKATGRFNMASVAVKKKKVS